MNRSQTHPIHRPSSADDVLEVIAAVQSAGIPFWIDGGWGIDALIGEQTREHADLDCVIALSDATAVFAVLAALGFSLSADERPTRFVAEDPRGRVIDFHTVVFDSQGGGVQRLQDGSSWRYPAHGFTATGSIAGHPLPCLTAEVQALAHVGYEPDAKDFHDMHLLTERFGVAFPPAFREPR